MSIPPRFLDEIRNRLRLSDVIGKRVKVTRAGREHKACCPFHNEKTPSFTINDDKQFYHCFGCGAHGDVIGFVMNHDNISFRDSVELLAAEAGLQVPKPDPMAQAKAEKQKDLYDLMDEATKWFQAALYQQENRDVLDYLINRGLTKNALEHFQIGFAPDDHQALRTHLKAHGYSDQQMIDAGVVKPSNKGRDPYVFFRGRVMFPVIDRRSKTVAYGGRTLPEHMVPPRQDGFTPPKYLNSSDTPLFDKGRMLYAEPFARQAAREGKPIIVTEGYMDVIACHQAGFEGAVAPMGTALTDEQILLLWKMCPDEQKTPILCFDGDSAGRKAASRSCERLLPMLKPGHSVRFAFMPEGEDPDTLIKSGGAEAFQKILKASIPMVDYLWAMHVGGREFKTPEERAGVIDSLQNQVSYIADKNVQSHYRHIINQKVSDTFFPKRDRYQQRGHSRSGGYSNQGNKPKLSVKPQTPMFQSRYIKALLAGVLNHPYIFDMIEEQFTDFDIPQQNFNLFRQAIVMALSHDPALDFDGLQQHLKDKGFGKEIRDILNETVYVHASFVRPGHDSEDVLHNWLAVWQSLQGHSVQEEIKADWKRVLQASNTDEEERIKTKVQSQISEST